MKRESFAVVAPTDAVIARKSAGMLALSVAQNQAQRSFQTPVDLIVRREGGYGPPADLFRVTRNEDGSIHTHTISRED